MSEPLKTIHEILGALREQVNRFNDEAMRFAMDPPHLDDDIEDDYAMGARMTYFDAGDQLNTIIKAIKSGQAQAAHKEAAYEEAWDRMIKVMQGMHVGQTVIRDAAEDKKLWHSLDGTLIALELMLEEMQKIQARIEAGE